MPSERPRLSEPGHAVERELFLRSMAFDRRFASATKQIADLMRDAFVEAGTALYEQGDPADEVYFIVHGSVRTLAPGVQDRTFGPRSLVGIMDAQQDRPHTRSAVAETDVEALVVRTEDWLEVLEDNFEYARALILSLAERLHELTLELPDGGFPEPRLEAAPAEREPMALVERVLTLRDVPAFRRAGIQALVSLAPVAEEVRVRRGELLFSPGQIKGVFFVVARGLVELERAEPHIRARFASAAIVGGSAALGDAERFYTARALQDSVLLRIEEEDFFDIMEDHFDLARSVTGYIAAQRESVLDEIERRRSQAPARPAA